MSLEAIELAIKIATNWKGTSFPSAQIELRRMRELIVAAEEHFDCPSDDFAWERFCSALAAVTECKSLEERK